MRRLAWVMSAIVLAPTAVDAQTLGTFRWQLQPHCNVLTVTVVQQGGQYQVDGTDDQCGAAQQASVVGRAFPNPDGSIGFGLTTVTTSHATAIHIDARLSVATLGGTWHDSAGNSGTFAFTPGAGTGGTPRPVPAGGIAPGTITSAHLAPSAVSGAVAALGTCPAGQFLRGFQNGTTVCEQNAVSPTTSVLGSPNGGFGGTPALVIGADGKPVIAHQDSVALDLLVTVCRNTTCSAHLTTRLDSLGTVGVSPSVAIGIDGIPIVAHRDFTNGDLRVTHCANGTCTSGTTTTVDAAGQVGEAPVVAIGGDGLAVIVHRDTGNHALRLTHCGDVACTSASTAVIATDEGWFASMAVGPNGLPVVAYQNVTETRLIRCQNAGCTSATSTVVGAINGTGGTAVVAPADGRPIVVWQDDGVVFAVSRCTDAACGAVTISSLSLDVTLSGAALGGDGVLRIAGSSGDQPMTLARCDDLNCGHPAVGTFDIVGSAQALSMGVAPDGTVILAYWLDSSGQLAVVRCNSATCS